MSRPIKFKSGGKVSIEFAEDNGFIPKVSTFYATTGKMKTDFYYLKETQERNKIFKVDEDGMVDISELLSLNDTR